MAESQLESEGQRERDHALELEHVLSEKTKGGCRYCARYTARGRDGAQASDRGHRRRGAAVTTALRKPQAISVPEMVHKGPRR